MIYWCTTCTASSYCMSSWACCRAVENARASRASWHQHGSRFHQHVHVHRRARVSLPRRCHLARNENGRHLLREWVRRTSSSAPRATAASFRSFWNRPPRPSFRSRVEGVRSRVRSNTRRPGQAAPRGQVSGRRTLRAIRQDLPEVHVGAGIHRAS